MTNATTLIILMLFLTIFSSYESNYCQSDKHLYLKYLNRVKDTCSAEAYFPDKAKYSIRLKFPSTEKKSFPEIYYSPCSYQWDKVFNEYSLEERIRIIEELLSFSDDTAMSSKKVCKYGYTTANRPKTKIYTLQVEALYLLTTLTVSSYSVYYCPYPVIVDILTGEEVNNNQQKVKEVYAVYRNWIEKNRKTKFHDFEMPLKNSHYEWYGANKKKDFIFGDGFRIRKIQPALGIIGKCKD